VYRDDTFGFLRLTISPASIAGVFVTVNTTSGKTGVGDSFAVDLHTNTVSSGRLGKTSRAPAEKQAASPKAKRASRPPAKGTSKVSAKPPKAKSKSTTGKNTRR
jgi:hypothetical protein